MILKKLKFSDLVFIYFIMMTTI